MKLWSKFKTEEEKREALLKYLNEPVIQTEGKKIRASQRVSAASKLGISRQAVEQFINKYGFKSVWIVDNSKQIDYNK